MPVMPIEHVVLLCMENRSFDHYLGALSLDPIGRKDVNGLTTPPFTAPDSDGNPVSSWQIDATDPPAVTPDFPDPISSDPTSSDPISSDTAQARELAPYFFTLRDVPPAPLKLAELFGSSHPVEVEVGTERRPEVRDELVALGVGVADDAAVRVPAFSAAIALST